MHIGALKKWALALSFWLALHSTTLRAQIFSNDLPLQAVTTGSNPVDFEFRADGTMIAKGNFGVGSLVSGDEGAGTRMLWFAGSSAFRAGTVDGTQWDTSNIGQYSVALGFDTTASGYYSTALGGSTNASGDWSVAMGRGNVASGQASLAAGYYSAAAADYSDSIGFMNLVNGGQATALGFVNQANGWVSTAMGAHTNASGDVSTASGYATTADSYVSFTIGTYNIGGGTGSSWVTTDPLFEIGNGTSTTPSDALIVYKNGNAVLQGTLQVAPGGDIPMYTGN